MKKIAVLLILAGLVCSECRAEAELVHVANLFMAGGQHYLDSDPSTFGGNMSLFYSPAIKYSQKDTLVPVFNVDYRGTQDVQELVGGGVLTRQTLDAGALLKYIRLVGKTRAKLRLGYKKSLVNETEDESWTEGLFDYNRILIGVEAEKIISGYLMSFSIDRYTVSFPNYSSLVSEDEYASSIDTQTYTEISANAGENVLDYTSLVMSIDAEKKYSDNFRAVYGYQFALNNYSDQTVVTSDGSFSSDKRSDNSNTLTAGMLYNSGRLELSLKNNDLFVSSNQNSFDANAAKYIGDFYSYYLVSLIPKIALYLGPAEKPGKLSLWWDIGWQRYSGRLAQDVNANYLSDKVTKNENAFGISYGHPLGKNLYIRIQASRNTVTSNMKYEADYKYNYTVSNYHIGLNWEFGG